MSKVGSDKRRRDATYRKGFQAGVASVTTWAQAEGEASKIEYRFSLTGNDGCAIVLSHWPEGYALERHGEIVWREWLDKNEHPDSVDINCQFMTVKVVSDIDHSKPVPLRLKRDDENPNLWATPDGRRVFNSEEWALKSMEMDTPAYKEASLKRMEASRLVNAEVVEDYDGWVTTTGDEDDYASGVAELLEKHADRLAWDGMGVEDIPANLPSWAFCCREDTFDFDIEDAIRNYVADNHHEDAADFIKDWDSLNRFWAAWVRKQKGVLSYFIDMKRIVVIDRERYEAELSAATQYLRTFAASEGSDDGR